MKKLLAGVITSALLVLVCDIPVLAAPVCSQHYVDADGDGYCDYCNEACHYVDADADGYCDNCNEACHYVDADADGYCDNCNKACHYTDADQDGYCDNCGLDTCRERHNSNDNTYRTGRHGHGTRSGRSHHGSGHC